MDSTVENNKEDSFIPLKKLLQKKWILLMLIPLIITVVVRLQPMQLVPMEKAAESNVMNYYRSQFASQINQQFPNLPEDQKNKMMDEKFSEYLKTMDQNVLKAQIKQNADSLKSRLQYQSGNKTYVYLGDIDSYYWIRMARNIIEKGSQCDVIQNKVCYDSYTTAPNLRAKSFDFYPVVIVGIYKIIKPFNKDITIMQASFLTPLFLSLLFTIPLFLLLRRIGGNIAAVVGTVLVNVDPNILVRSLGSDSDIINIFFQVIFLWLAIECFYSNSFRKKCVWSVLCSICLCVYSRFWGGWWYPADLFIISLLFLAFFLGLHKWYSIKKIQLDELRKPFTEILLIISFFIIAMIVFYTIIWGSPSEFFSIMQGQFGVLKFKVASNANLWPNVLTTVAEFNGVGLPQVISTTGNIIRIPVFLMAMLGCTLLIFPTVRFINKNLLLFFILLVSDFFLYIFLKTSSHPLLVFLILIPVIIGLYAHFKSKEETEFHPDAIFILSTLVCSVVYFSTVGARFLFLMIVPVNILASLFFSRATVILLLTLKKIAKMPNIVYYFIIVLFISYSLLPSVKAGIGSAQGYLPMVTDEWVATLEKIKTESKPDAIINSWWDYGHWFKYFADRRVTLDGSSQNSPQLHWLGKLLLTSDEDTSKGILRMLDCGANNAFDAINGRLNDIPHSIDVLNEIIVQNKTIAKEILSNHNFTSEQIETVLRYTHCNPPKDFLITSQDMIGKTGVWAHFGSWDFKKSYLNSVISSTSEDEIIKKFSDVYDTPKDTTRSWIKELRSLKDQGSINAWIAPWPGYMSGINQCGNEGNISVCPFSQGGNQIPVYVDFEKKECYVVGQDGKKVYPQMVAFIDGNSFDLIKHSQDTIGFGIDIVKSGASVGAMFTSPELTGSMFTRLFFFEGAGLSSFQKFYDTTNVYGERIIAWKIAWDNVDK